MKNLMILLTTLFSFSAIAQGTYIKQTEFTPHKYMYDTQTDTVIRFDTQDRCTLGYLVSGVQCSKKLGKIRHSNYKEYKHTNPIAILKYSLDQQENIIIEFPNQTLCSIYQKRTNTPCMNQIQVDHHFPNLKIIERDY